MQSLRRSETITIHAPVFMQVRACQGNESDDFCGVQIMSGYDPVSNCQIADTVRFVPGVMSESLDVAYVRS